MKPTMIHTFKTTAAAIGAFLIVKGASGNLISAATAATDSLIGTTDSLGAEASTECGIALEGVGQVKLGGTVNFGDFITADSASKGVAAAPTNSTNQRTIGQALEDGVSGDIIRYRVSPGIMPKPSA